MIFYVAFRIYKQVDKVKQIKIRRNLIHFLCLLSTTSWLFSRDTFQAVKKNQNPITVLYFKIRKEYEKDTLSKFSVTLFTKNQRLLNNSFLSFLKLKVVQQSCEEWDKKRNHKTDLPLGLVKMFMMARFGPWAFSLSHPQIIYLYKELLCLQILVTLCYCLQL